MHLWPHCLQAVHHGDKPSELTMRSFKRFLVDSPLRHTGPAAYAAGVAGRQRDRRSCCALFALNACCWCTLQTTL